MSTPERPPQPRNARPALGHVNLMIDTFIANASLEDLRSIVMNLLSTGPPSFTADFTKATRTRLYQTSTEVAPRPYSYFVQHTDSSAATPTKELHGALLRVRSLYGAGMGFASLAALTSAVRASIGLRWESDGVTADTLAAIDADIGQAIQSCKEEVESARVGDVSQALRIIKDLQEAVNESLADTKLRGGEFPFERASWSIQQWRI